MAINPTFSSTPTLAKIKIGESVYWLKDAELRSIVSAFGNATAKDAANTITSTGTNLPTESAVYNEIVSQVGALGTVLNLLSESKHTDVTSPAKGDFVVEADGKEWLYDGTAWREVGDESAYVMKTFEIAGIALSGSEITVEQLVSALSLGSLAFKDSASGDLTNYVTGLNGASYTPAGSVSVELSQTKTAADVTTTDYTPAGSVNVELSQTATTATLTKGDYTPQGTVTVTPSTASFSEIASLGKAASLTSGTGSFATEGITAAVDTTDTEMLVFTAAGTANAVNSITFDGGAAPTFKSEATTFVTGISSAAFQGSEVKSMNVTAVTYDKATLSSASFSGTKVESTFVTGVSYSKADVSSAAFSGTSATITPTLTSTTKTVTVS